MIAAEFNHTNKLNILLTNRRIAFLLRPVVFHIGDILMLSAAFYERIIGVIGEENLRGLTTSQETNLKKKYKKLLDKKGGDLDEISFDDIFEVWLEVS